MDDRKKKKKSYFLFIFHLFWFFLFTLVSFLPNFALKAVIFHGTITIDIWYFQFESKIVRNRYKVWMKSAEFLDLSKIETSPSLAVSPNLTPRSCSVSEIFSVFVEKPLKSGTRNNDWRARCVTRNLLIVDLHWCHDPREWRSRNLSWGKLNRCASTFSSIPISTLLNTFSGFIPYVLTLYWVFNFYVWFTISANGLHLSLN